MARSQRHNQQGDRRSRKLAAKELRAERWEGWVKRNPAVVIISLAALVISAVVTVSGTVTRLNSWYSRTYNWRSTEYDKLQALRAGFSEEKFKDVLGSPLFVRQGAAGAVTERSFQGRDYWVQTLTDSYGTVVMFSVTACDSDFKPQFTVPGGPTVILNKSTFASLGGEGLDAAYQFVTVTGSRRMIDRHYGANPGNYKSFAWGLNDACATFSDQLQDLREKGVILDGSGSRSFRYEGPANGGGTGVQEFRATATINTYAETAPKVGWQDEVLQQFPVGVERVLIRTVVPVSE